MVSTTILFTRVPDMSEVSKPKYVDPYAEYHNSLKRSTFAIPKELFPFLETAIKTSGANSVSDLLRVIAANPEEAGEALKPLVERSGVAHNPRARKKYLKTQINELAAMLKDSKLSADEFAALQEQIKKQLHRPTSEQL
jgi:hypothetical protein